jgi:hypothetical protein
MSVIEASFVKLASLVDGTLRVTFDVEPLRAKDCFALFNAPGAQAAIARLIKPAADNHPRPEPERVPGHSATTIEAFKISKDIDFWSWAQVANETEASMYIKHICRLEHRTDLDDNEEARNIFRRQILIPFNQWKASQ